MNVKWSVLCFSVREQQKKEHFCKKEHYFGGGALLSFVSNKTVTLTYIIEKGSANFEAGQYGHILSRWIPSITCFHTLTIRIAHNYAL